jgi:hypothetical protein
VRLANRALGALLSVALACVGALLIIEVVADRLRHRTALVDWHPAYRWAARTTWTAGSVRVAAGILIAAGLVLLIAELKPPRVSRLAADPGQAGAPGMDTAYTHRGVAAAVRSAVSDVDGVRGASVKVTRRRVSVAATATVLDRTAAQALREPVTAAARERLEALSLRRAAALSVRVAQRRH